MACRYQFHYAWLEYHGIRYQYDQLNEAARREFVNICGPKSTGRTHEDGIEWGSSLDARFAPKYEFASDRQGIPGNTLVYDRRNSRQQELMKGTDPCNERYFIFICSLCQPDPRMGLRSKMTTPTICLWPERRRQTYRDDCSLIHADVGSCSAAILGNMQWMIDDP